MRSRRRASTQLIDQIAALQAERDAAIQEAAENLAALQRSAADFQNYKRRTEQERETTRRPGQRVVAPQGHRHRRRLRPGHRGDARADWPATAGCEGIAAIDRKLRMLLESEGVTPIEALGRPFDPRQHEALTQIETTDVPEDTIVAEIQRGYRVRDRILRPVARRRRDQP